MQLRMSAKRWSSSGDENPPHPIPRQGRGISLSHGGEREINEKNTFSRQNLSIVLVGPRGDANIGAVCRAMKNFGLKDLRLVDSVEHLTRDAHMWAVDAKDILNEAKLYGSLKDALADVATAVAFTRRIGKGRKRTKLMRDACPWILTKTGTGRVALVFGREDDGLTGSEVALCDATIEIPTDMYLPSLNLAQAVIIACYELYMYSSTEAHKFCEGSKVDQEFVSKEEVDKLLKRFDGMLSLLKYEDSKDHPLKSKILFQLDKIFGRAGLSERDVKMFEGLITRIGKS